MELKCSARNMSCHTKHNSQRKKLSPLVLGFALERPSPFALSLDSTLLLRAHLAGGFKLSGSLPSWVDLSSWDLVLCVTWLFTLLFGILGFWGFPCDLRGSNPASFGGRHSMMTQLILLCLYSPYILWGAQCLLRRTRIISSMKIGHAYHGEED